jgi:hypothetical protein
MPGEAHHAQDDPVRQFRCGSIRFVDSFASEATSSGAGSEQTSHGSGTGTGRRPSSLWPELPHLHGRSTAGLSRPPQFGWNPRQTNLLLLSGVIGIAIVDTLFFMCLNHVGAGVRRTDLQGLAARTIASRNRTARTVSPLESRASATAWSRGANSRRRRTARTR